MIKPLTSLRFVFALMVFASHLGFLANEKSSFFESVYNLILREGYIGVSFFFILSGFILAYNYQDRLSRGETSKRNFYLARIARIYPLHILTFIISLPLTYKIFVLDKGIWVKQALANISLIQSYFPIKSVYFSFNAPSWSISDEMFFYLAFPFLILLVPILRDYRKTFVLSIIAVVSVMLISIPENYYHQIFYINPFMRIIDFMIGIFIYNVYRKFSQNKINIKSDLLEVSSVILLIVFFLFHQLIPEVARYSFYYWIPMGYLIFSFSFQGGKISKFLSGKTFIHLGEISFGFYMFHQLVIRYFNAINTKFLHLENTTLIIVIIFLVSLTISHYSFILFETPMNSFIKKIKRRKKVYIKTT